MPTTQIAFLRWSNVGSTLCTTMAHGWHTTLDQCSFDQHNGRRTNKTNIFRIGIPQRVISDNGPHFTGEAYQQFVCTWEIEHVTSTPRYPMSNGMVEIEGNQNCKKYTRQSSAKWC